ncbi:S8 family peptidase [Priestia endophytica]|uniref:S8 family peptidase n=1 Tax=Priestia endophytica TaxID=135735 RepID=UPI0022828F4D|nr:S8 family peptidase [Priestia endophytica]MCY8231623.1 S8 family peptidase [Priestia endophytica]
MLEFSMIQLVRRMGNKLDKNMQQKLIKSYSLFRFAPCFLHRPLEYMRKKIKILPLIIEFKQDSFRDGLNDVRNTKCHMLNEFPSISCCATKLSLEKIEQLLENCCHIKKIYYDRKVTALLDIAPPAIHSNQLKENSLTGKGVTIGIVDTGIHPHRDLQGRIKGFKDFINNRIAPYDDNGHGTHCAGGAAGNGSIYNGKYQGPSPEASLIGIKVLDKMGIGSLSTVISGVEWCIQNQSMLGIDILSLSLDSLATQYAEDNPVVKAVEKAWDNGMIVCVAAGSTDSLQGIISIPGISPKVITVRTISDNNTIDYSDDSVANFPGRVPTIDCLKKLDPITLRENIISLQFPKFTIDRLNSNVHVDTDYVSLLCTSMATPICAGLAAQLLQNQPNLTPDQVKQQLIINICQNIGQSSNTLKKEKSNG